MCVCVCVCVCVYTKLLVRVCVRACVCVRARARTILFHFWKARGPSLRLAEQSDPGTGSVTASSMMTAIHTIYIMIIRIFLILSLY